MKLRELLRDVSPSDRDLDITAVAADSRLVVPGALFVAIPGTQQDGAKYIAPARRKGAAVVVGETADADIRVDDARFNGVMKLAEHARLRDAVAHIARRHQCLRRDLVLVLRIRTHQIGRAHV